MRLVTGYTRRMRAVTRRRVMLLLPALIASLLAAGGNAHATESFRAPEFTSDACANKKFPPVTGPTLGLTPDMIAGVVGVPVPVSGTPAAQTVVVVGLGQSVNQAVVREFLTRCGLDPATWTDVVWPVGGTPPVGLEATLDLTVLSGILPANTTLRTATIASGFNFPDALINAGRACGFTSPDLATWTRSQLATPTGGCIISMSYAVFEKSLPNIIPIPTELQAFMAQTEAVLAALAGAGVITVISSGDEGSGGCLPLSRGKRNEMAPQWPSTSANALSIGGTMWAPLDWNGAAITPGSSYVPGAQLMPVAWRNWGLGSDCLWTEAVGGAPAITWPAIGTTGGESGYVTRPSYQRNVASVLPGSTGRLSPDISALAGWPAWLIPENNDATKVNYGMGTSAAAPLVAAGLAHVNASLTARGLAPIDNAGGSMDVHNILYDPSFSSAINDVTQGSNNLWSSDLWTGPTAVATPAELPIGFLDRDGEPTANVFSGYESRVGYDLTTGLGVPNFTRLANLLIARNTPPAPAPSPTPTPTPSPTPTPAPTATPTPTATPAPVAPAPNPVDAIIADPSAVTAAALAALTPSQIAQIPPAIFSQLPAAAFRGLSAPQARALTTGQVAAIRPARARAIRPAVVRSLRPAQVAVLRPASVRALRPKQVSALRPAQMRALSTRQVQAMRPKQVRALRPVQVRALTPKQQVIVNRKR